MRKKTTTTELLPIATRPSELDPEYTNAFVSRGNAYANKGDNDLAIADYNEAIQLNPNAANAFANRCFSYWKKGDNDRAITDCNEAIRTRSQER